MHHQHHGAEGQRQQQALAQRPLAKVDELGKQAGEEDDRLGVEQADERPLDEAAPAIPIRAFAHHRAHRALTPGVHPQIEQIEGAPQGEDLLAPGQPVGKPDHRQRGQGRYHQ